MILEKVRTKIGIRLFRRTVAKLLANEIKERNYAPTVKKRLTYEEDRQNFYDWIKSDDGTRTDDVEFFYTFLEQVLIKLENGELTDEEVLNMANVPALFRTKRLVEEKDQELIRKLEEQEEAEPVVIKEAEVPEENATVAPESFLETLFKKAQVDANDQWKTAMRTRKQYILEKQRMQSRARAVLANTPEILELMGKDSFKSEKQQKREERKVVNKETEKLRGRLVEEMPEIRIPKEKTPKQMAQEKMEILRKMKKNLGKGGLT